MQQKQQNERVRKMSKFKIERISNLSKKTYLHKKMFVIKLTVIYFFFYCLFSKNISFQTNRIYRSSCFAFNSF
jgi:hypothetical protein